MKLKQRMYFLVIIVCLVGMVQIPQPVKGNAAGTGEPIIRVNLSYPFSEGNPGALSVTIHGTYKMNGVALSNGNTYQIAPDGKGGVVCNRANGERIIGATLLTLTTSNRSSDYIELLIGNGYTYREGMEFQLSGSAVQPINIVGMENYLKGVVPSEMYPSWGKEALKAQAVAARSYFWDKIRQLGSNYTAKDDTSFQVYHGMKEEQPSTTDAVNETKGMVVSYGGSPISALFHSTNGGYSELNSNVWNGDTTPYYGSKPDPYDAKVPNYKNWEVVYGADQVQQILLQKGVNVGQIQDLQVLSTYASGRIEDLAIVGNQGTVHIGKNSARTDFSLNSAMYKVNNNQKVWVLTGNGTRQEMIVQGKTVLSSGKNVQSTGDLAVVGADGSTRTLPAHPTFTFTGSGFGHGVGMSQYGAMEMAKEGKTVQDILSFYYPNTSLISGY